MKVAELFATLGVDASEFDKDLKGATTRGGRQLAQLVAEGERTGEQAGKALADGVAKGGDQAGRKAAEGLGDATARARAAGDQVGTRAGRALGDAVEAEAAKGGKAAGSALSEDLSNELLSGVGNLPGPLGNVLSSAVERAGAGVAGAAAISAGAAVGAGILKGITDAIEREAIDDKLAARLNLTEAQAATAGRVTGQAWSQGFGDSREEVADAIDAVFSTLDEGRGEEGLERLVTKALTLADVLQTDVTMAVDNAGIVLEAGLARTADNAFDLITAAAQRVPRGVRDELEDATEEYSQFFGRLGFSGEEAFGMLVLAAKEGRYEIDKTGDAIKELYVRAGSTGDLPAMEALDRLGLAHEEYAAKIAGGGPAARQAVQEIVEAIAGVQDPAKQLEIATALMGAPFEDMASDMPEFVARMNEAAGAMRDTEGAADGLASAYDNVATNWEIVKRSVQEGLADIGEDILAPLAGAIEGDAGSIVSGLGRALRRGLDVSPLAGVDDMAGAWWQRLFGGGEEEAEREGEAAGRAAAQGAKRGVESVADVDLPDWAPVKWLRFDVTQLQETEKEAADRTRAFWEEIARLGDEALGASADLRVGEAAARSFTDSIARSTQLDDQMRAGLATGSALRSLREAMFGAAEAAEDAEAEIEDTYTAVDRLSDAARRSDPKLSALGIRLGSLSAAAEGFRRSIDQRSLITDQVSAAVSWGDAFDSVVDTIRHLPRNLDMGALLGGRLSDDQRAAIGSVTQMRDAYRDYLAELIRSGESAEVVRQRASHMRDEFARLLRVIGLSSEQVRQWQRDLGMTPEAVEVSLRVAGEDAARFQVESFLSLLQGRIPDHVAVEVATMLEGNDLQGAARRLAAWAKTNPARVPVEPRVDKTKVAEAEEELARLPRVFDPIKAALGEYSDAEQRALEGLMRWGDAAQQSIAELVEAGDLQGARDLASAFRGQLDQLLPVGAAAESYQEALGLLPRQIETAISLSGTAEAITKLQLLKDRLGEESIPRQIESKIRAAVAEGDFVAAANLMSAFVTDMQDGVMDNPILLALVGNPEPAKGAVDQVRKYAKDHPVDLFGGKGLGATPGQRTQPITIPLDADDTKAVEEHLRYVMLVTGVAPEVPLDANDIKAVREYLAYVRSVTGQDVPMPLDADDEPAWRRYLAWVKGVQGTRVKIPLDVEFSDTMLGNALTLGGLLKIPGVNAPRRHTGGLVPGALHEEVPIVALGGERVLTVGDQRELADLERTVAAQLGAAVGPGAPGGGPAGAVAAQQALVDLAGVEEQLGRVAGEVRELAGVAAAKGEPIIVNEAEHGMSTARRIQIERDAREWARMGRRG